MEDKVKILVDKYDFSEWTAEEYIDAKGKCVYCGTDLLYNLNSFHAADIDHIFPKSKYPELEAVKNNLALCCRACNGMKGKMDLKDIPWPPREAVENHRQELIEIIREKLRENRLRKEEELKNIRKIVQGE